MKELFLNIFSHYFTYKGMFNIINSVVYRRFFIFFIVIKKIRKLNRRNKYKSDSIS